MSVNSKLYKKNQKKVVIEEHISFVKEPGFEFIGHESVGTGRAQTIEKHIVFFFLCVYNNTDTTKFLAIGCDLISVNSGFKRDVIRNM